MCEAQTKVSFLGYLIYIFLLAYASFGGKTPGFELGKQIALFVVWYFLNIAVVFYILSKISQISFIHQFLENLLTKKSIHDYLGLHVTSQIVIRLLLPMSGLVALDIFSMKYFSTHALSVVMDFFFMTYKNDMVNWSEEIKKDYIVAMLEVIEKTKHGSVTNSMNGELVRSLISMIHNIVEKRIKIIFKN